MAATLGDLAALVHGELNGPADREVVGVGGVERAGDDQLTFVSDKRFAEQLARCRAAAVVLPRDLDVPMPEGMATLRVEAVDPAMLRIITVLHPTPRLPVGVHERAVVDPSATLGEEVAIGPYVVIEAGARVGARTQINAGSYVGQNVVIGEDCVFQPHVVVAHDCTVGNRVVLHPGVVIGSDGFGYARAGGGVVKVPQVGTVVLEDDVEVHYNTGINRARLDETRIGRGSKVDGLTHLAHNCRLGEDVIMCGRSASAGSSYIGNKATLGADVCLADHVEIGEGVILMAGARVTQDIPSGVHGGYIRAMPRKDFHRFHRAVNKLPQVLERVAELEARIRELEQSAADTRG